MQRPSGFSLSNYSHDDPKAKLEKPSVYVWGEVYSDYQAFVEGALRSVGHVLHRVKPGKFAVIPTRWACGPFCPSDEKS